jgi:hypothetical protein
MEQDWGGEKDEEEEEDRWRGGGQKWEKGFRGGGYAASDRRVQIEEFELKGSDRRLEIEEWEQESECEIQVTTIRMGNTEKLTEKLSKTLNLRNTQILLFLGINEHW